MTLQKATYFLLFSIALVGILVVGKDLILPLAIAFFISFVITELQKILSKIRIGSFQLPLWFQHVMSFGIIVILLVLFGNLLYLNIQNISDVIPIYQTNVTKLISSLDILKRFDFELLSKEWLNAKAIGSYASVVLESLSGILSNSFLILLYLIFIRLENNLFSKKIELLYQNKTDYTRVRTILQKINDSMSRYIGLKTITSISTGVLSFLVLSLLDIDFAFFWAFLIFVLNYIPTIGSLLATLFPFIIALLQYGNFKIPIILLIAVGSIQFLVGNVIEPKLMGNSLNVSPLVVLVSLAFWGAIWGVAGMVLSVPITIMLIIICSQFKSTQWLAILLSENGEVLDKK